MIETLLIQHLSDHLDVPVVMEAPEQVTNYVLIDKTGSSRRNHITTSTFAIQSYAPSLYEAMELNAEVAAVMETLLELNAIVKVDYETDYNFTDMTTKQYRWQSVYNITHY